MAESRVKIGAGKLDGSKSMSFVPDGQQSFLHRILYKVFITGELHAIIVKPPVIKAVHLSIGLLVAFGNLCPFLFFYLQSSGFNGG